MPNDNHSIIRLAIAFVGVVALSPLSAQEPTLTPREIGQIIQVALDTLVPPTAQLSRVPVSKREIRVDFERTLKKFGFGEEHIPELSQSLRGGRAQAAKTEILANCPQVGGPCDRMGLTVYAWLEPVSVSDSEVCVRSWFLWADRGGRTAAMVGFAREIYFARSAGGQWKFVKRGRELIL